MRYLLITLKFLTKLIPHQIKHPLAVWIFRRLILTTKPITVQKYQADIGICTLLCHDHIYFYLISVKSFFYFTKLELPVFVVDDGSMTNEDVQLLNRHVQNITIVRGKEAEKIMISKLRGLPFSLRFRKESHSQIYSHNKKLFDPILLSSFKKYIYFDSDIIFFNKPREIINWIHNSKDMILHMSYTKEYMQHTDLQILNYIPVIFKIQDIPNLNSGIICGYKKFLKLDLIEKYLKDIYSYSLAHKWFSEQIIFYLVFSKMNKLAKIKKIQPLDPLLYYVLVNSVMRKYYRALICIHYHSYSKDYIYYDGIKLLINSNFLTA